VRQGDLPPVTTGENTYANGVAQFYKELTAYALKRRKKGQVLIATGHLDVLGAYIADEEPSERAAVGGLDGIDRETFSPELQYVALGHLHDLQAIKQTPLMMYCGSPIGMSFTEKEYMHCAIELDYDKGVKVGAEIIPYDNVVELQSIPEEEGEAVTLNKALKEIAKLPNASEDDEIEVSPFLEVRVRLSAPEPTLRSQIEEAVKGKFIRLTRVVSVYKKGVVPGDSEQEYSSNGLQEMKPIDIARMNYLKTYDEEMPDELEHIFAEAMLAINTGE
jgi:exonuclease SbcD